jgi:ribosomal-protein-alanine N-acetyltransferase
MIETPRLKLIPLKVTELRLLTKSRYDFERETGFIYAANDLSKHLIQLFRSQADQIDSDPDHWQWLTFWVIVEKQKNEIIGSIDFKNWKPDEFTIEIGYGLGEAYRNQGYMREACLHFCQYGFSQGITTIVAETNRFNVPSSNVLRNCGFYLDRQIDNSLWWKLECRFDYYHYACEINVKKPIQSVFSVFTNLETMIDWEEGLLEIESKSGHFPDQGSIILLKFAKMELLTTVIENRLPYQITLIYETHGVKNVCVNTFSEIDDLSTHWTMISEFNFNEKINLPIENFLLKTKKGMNYFKDYLESSNH